MLAAAVFYVPFLASRLQSQQVWVLPVSVMLWTWVLVTCAGLAGLRVKNIMLAVTSYLCRPGAHRRVPPPMHPRRRRL